MNFLEEIVFESLSVCVPYCRCFSELDIPQKDGWIYGHNYIKQEQAQLSIFEWIENWYNRRRRHSALGYQTIEEFEKNNYKFKTAA